MTVYKKIGKKKSVTYFYGKNRSNSSYACIYADLSKIREGEFDQIVAWVDKAKNIEWNENYEHLIDKNYIKAFIVNL